jgi:tetratricopeptide repeat protein 21B
VEKLLQDLTKLGEANSVRYKILESYSLIATKQKPRIEKALNEFTALAETDQNNVATLYGMAVCYDLLSQPTKAKNHLKRISKMKYDSNYAVELERSWLMLANIYIQVGKYEFATELCKKCLNHNKSSAAAWEMLGLMMEKESSYASAAEDYEQAWKYQNESNPAVGYKLSFNYLKAKRYVEAIDICHKVLALYPDYPKIKKEILEKARASLRP